MQNETKKLNGISCEVETCVHNDGHCCCTANSIKVKNRMDILGDETMCDTYQRA